MGGGFPVTEAGELGEHQGLLVFLLDAEGLLTAVVAAPMGPCVLSPPPSLCPPECLQGTDQSNHTFRTAIIIKGTAGGLASQ